MSYDEIAGEEGVTATRIRQIVSEVLKKRAVDSGAEHAKLQLERLIPAMQLAAEAIAAGDVTAIAPYLKVLDRLDRYQSVASANQEYDDEARKKLLDKINRLAENLGVNEVVAAAVREHLKTIGEFPATSRARPRGKAFWRAWLRSSRRSKAGRPNGCPFEALVAQPDRRVEAAG